MTKKSSYTIKGTDFWASLSEDENFLYLFNKLSSDKSISKLVGVFCNKATKSSIDFDNEGVLRYIELHPDGEAPVSAFQRKLELENFMLRHPEANNVNQAAYDRNLIKEIIKAQELFKKNENHLFDTIN